MATTTRAKVEVEGFEAFLDKLDELPSETQRAIGVRWCQMLGQFVAIHARIRAPKRSGKMAREIEVDTDIKTPTFVRVAVQIRAFRFGRQFYPRWQEFGTEHIRAQRFLRDSLTAGQNAAGPMLVAIVNTHLRELEE